MAKIVITYRKTLDGSDCKKTFPVPPGWDTLDTPQKREAWATFKLHQWDSRYHFRGVQLVK